MKTGLSSQQFIELKQSNRRIAVHQIITTDRLTPVSIVQALQADFGDAVILESGLQNSVSGRFSFIAYNPIATLVANHQVVTCNIDGHIRTSQHDPFVELREMIAQMNCSGSSEEITQLHGAIGFISYDAIRHFEEIPDRHCNSQQLPELFFNFYQLGLMFDHQQQQLVISCVCDLERNPNDGYEQSRATIENVISLIDQSTPHASNIASAQSLSPATCDLDDETFIKMVERAQQHIRQGDVFQVVLSRNFLMNYHIPPFAIYRTLRRNSPAPYMFHLPTPYGLLVGASPETFIRVQNGTLTINPIAGTRPRTDRSHDDAITADLLSDEKETAEHMMLVDLARNDLGRICQTGSINIEELMKVKHYTSISHITSTITGKISAQHDAIDALKSAFPAGTLSGAPKIRAMQLIDEIESSRRGIYGGAICRFDFAGNVDSCIAIRMALLRDGVAYIRTGAGIVNDSNAQSEANETKQKAQTMLRAIQSAHEEVL